MAKKNPGTARGRARPSSASVSRKEFERVAAIATEGNTRLTGLQHDIDIQFKRMAQIQSELEQLQRRLQALSDLSRR